MNLNDLFKCSPLIKSLYSEIKNSDADTERVVFWGNTKVPLKSSPSDDSLHYVEVAHDETSVLLDPATIPECKSQLKMLQQNGLLKRDSHDQVMIVTVRLHEQIETLSDDLTINREVIHTVEDFKTIRGIWERFNVDPMNSFSWNLSWWKAFQSHGDLHLMRFERAGKTVGIAPLYVDRWFGLKRLRFLATGDACTDYADLICDPQHYDLCVWSLAEYVREQKFHVVELECTRDDRLTNRIKSNLECLYRFDHRIVESTWRFELPDTMEQFSREAKRSLRRKINKAVRRIESGEFEIKTSFDDLDIATAFGILKDLHTRRWNALNGPGIFADEQFEDFLEMAIFEFHQEGKCEIVAAYQCGEPIAAQLYFISSEGFQLYQSGYAPEAMKLEPGHLLFTSMVKRAIKRGDTYFDFLRGNEPYKEFWGAKPHTQTKLRMVARKLFPRIVAKVVERTRRITRGAQTSFIQDHIYNPVGA